jgi:hypothetical protein
VVARSEGDVGSATRRAREEARVQIEEAIMSALANAVYVLSILRAAIRADDSEKERAMVPAATRALSAGPWSDLLSVQILAYALDRAVRNGIQLAAVDVEDALRDVVELALGRVMTGLDDEPTYVPDGEEREPPSDTEPSPPSEEMACWAPSLPPESDGPRDSGAVSLTLRAPTSSFVRGKTIDVMA